MKYLPINSTRSYGTVKVSSVVYGVKYADTEYPSGMAKSNLVFE